MKTFKNYYQNLKKKFIFYLIYLNKLSNGELTKTEFSDLLSSVGLGGDSALVDKLF